jgi:DNA-directed RNA polymerase specialized sigma24 family protein
MCSVAENAVFVEKVLPVAKRFACAKFRYLRGFAKDEAIANALGLAYEHYHRALASGRDPAKFPVALARFACLRIRAGRGYGRQNSCDVMEGRTQAKFGYDREPLGDYRGNWAEVSDDVATRLDFAAWLDQLSPPRRRVMEALASGKSTAEVAAALGCGQHNVEYLRGKCRKDWDRCHAEA